jgi:phosphatidylglycerol---prolipoprotein diacylglyceryl transferase
VIGTISLVGAIGWKVLDRFHLGGSVAISPHGVGIAIGYLAGAYVMLFEARRRGIPEEKASSIVFWALVGAIVGARAFYVLGHFSEFNNVGEILAVYNGGISLLGGIFGAIIFAYPIVRRNKLGFLRAMDAASFGIPLGIVIGRIGDLVIGDHLGKPTSWALAFKYYGGNLAAPYTCSFTNKICGAHLAGGRAQDITRNVVRMYGADKGVVATGTGVHQTALYDFGATMLLVLLLIWLSRKPRRTGIITLTFGAWYATGRIITDFLRVDKTFFGMTGSQWTSVGVVIVCVATFVRFALRPEEPQSPEVALVDSG